MSHLISKPTSRSLLLRLLYLNSLPHSLCTSTQESRTQKLERIAYELLDLNKLERYDFMILWRLKMGLDWYGPAMTGVGSSGSALARAGFGLADVKKSAAAVEKTVFDIKLEKYDAAAKIKIIKEVRGFTNLGLKEAKDLVEKAPCVLKKGVTKDQYLLIQKLMFKWSKSLPLGSISVDTIFFGFCPFGARFGEKNTQFI